MQTLKPATDMRTTLDRVLDAVERIMDERPTAETTFGEIGDSLDMVECSMEVEEEFVIEIADDAVQPETTVQQLADIVDAALASVAR